MKNNDNWEQINTEFGCVGVYPPDKYDFITLEVEESCGECVSAHLNREQAQRLANFINKQLKEHK